MAQQPNKNYFASTSTVDWQQGSVFSLAQQLAAEVTTPEQLVQHTRAWVEKNISESAAQDSVSCCASEVLNLGKGSSFSKSHLLAALLRANGLASSFCYQRVCDAQQDLQLQGYCAVWLSGYGWYPLLLGQVTQQPISYRDGEFDYRLYSHTPLPEVVRVLNSGNCWEEVRQVMPKKISMG